MHCLKDQKLSTNHRNSDVIFSATRTLNSKMAIFNWSEEVVEELISLYEARPCLYDIKSKEYFNRNKRNKALQEIGEALGTTGKMFIFECRKGGSW